MTNTIALILCATAIFRAVLPSTKCVRKLIVFVSLKQLYVLVRFEILLRERAAAAARVAVPLKSTSNAAFVIQVSKPTSLSCYL